MKKKLTLLSCFIVFVFSLLISPSLAFSAAKPQFQYTCFPESLFVNSLDDVLDICLINQGAAGTLTSADYIVISIPTGTTNYDLITDSMSLNCSSSNGSWYCGNLQTVGNTVELTIHPSENFTVQAGEIICCQLRGVNVNSEIGMAFLNVNQQIGSNRADNPINTKISVFKTTSERQVFIEIDPKIGSSMANSIPKWNGSQLVDSSSISEDASGDVVRVDVSGDLNVAGIINGNISGNAATATNAANWTGSGGGTSAAPKVDWADNANKAKDADTVDGKHAPELLDTSASNQTKLGGLNINGNVGIGAESDPDKRLIVGGIIKSTQGFEFPDGTVQTSAGIPVGGIIMWSGSITNIPDGWALCDGTNGTPDLRDRFVMSVGTGESPGANGGSVNHIHSYSSVPIHSHSISPNPHAHSYTTLGLESGDGANYAWVGGFHIVNPTVNTGSTTLSVGNTGSASCTTNNASNIPPYYKLAFIMKL